MALEPARRRGTSKRLTACLFARAQLDDYKAAERVRESKRDRSARERAQDDGAQAAQRKRSKCERLAALWAWDATGASLAGVDPTDHGAAYMRRAIVNYAHFHDRDPETVTVDQVQSSAMGVSGWAETFVGAGRAGLERARARPTLSHL